MKALLFAFLLSALTLCGADVTGKWAGTLEMKDAQGELHTMPAYLIIKEENGKLTGSGGPNAQDQPGVLAGTVAGNVLNFTVDHDGRIMKFRLTRDGDDLKGSIATES